MDFLKFPPVFTPDFGIFSPNFQQLALNPASRWAKIALDGGSGGSKLVLALGVKELEGPVVIGFRHENAGGTTQIAVVGRGGVSEFLRGGDAVLLEHRHEHLGVDDRAGVKQFHARNLATDFHR